ncbi:hypothetical protein KIH41_07555 [Litoribacter ruber]|nr:hypothetical protein [Litoribacter ruber]
MEGDDALRTGFESCELISDPEFGENFPPGQGGGGNVACSDDYEESTGKIDYMIKVNGIEIINPNFKSDFEKQGFEIEVCEGKIVSYRYLGEECLGDVAIIVKGGSNPANVFLFAGNEGSGFYPPNNDGGKMAGLSNLTICYNFVPCEDEPPCEGSGESATGSGDPYKGNNNWFLHSKFKGEEVKLVYGRNHQPIGTVSFDDIPNSSKILVTVKLSDNAIFNEESGGDFKYRLFTSEDLKVGDVRGFRGWTKVPNDNPKEISFEVDKKISGKPVLRIGLHAEVTVFDCENDNDE